MAPRGRAQIAIVSALPDGRLPIVRQYRPALEGFTWELPAGLIDPDEDAGRILHQELMEEAGFCHPHRTCPRMLRALHGAPVEPGTFILCDIPIAANSATRYGDSHKYE